MSELSMIYQLAMFTFEVVGVPDDDDVDEVSVVDVGGSKGHDQIPQSDQRAVLVRKHRDDDVVLK